MAAAPLTPEEKAALLTSDLQMLFADMNITIPNQAKVYDSGLGTLRLFSTMADDNAKARAAIAEIFDLREDRTLPERIQVASLVAAWQKAQKRTSEKDQAEATAALAGKAPAIHVSDHRDRRNAYESKWGEVTDEDLPSKVFLELLESRLQDGEFRAETLEEASMEDLDASENPLFEIDKTSGNLKATTGRKGKKGGPPSGPEDFRRIFIKIEIAWGMMAARHSNRAYLQGLTPMFWVKYVQHLLGEEVYGLKSVDAKGKTVAQPSWPLLLSYEHQIRKKAWRLVETKNIPLVEAIKLAMKDEGVKSRYFITPLAVSGGNLVPTPETEKDKLGRQRSPSRKRSRSTRRQDSNRRHNEPKWGKKPKGKGKGKNRDKGKGSGSRLERTFPEHNGKKFSTKTPDGKDICFKFNSPHERCRDKNCRFEHVCGYCFEKDGHPAHMCGRKKKP